MYVNSRSKDLIDDSILDNCKIEKYIIDTTVVNVRPKSVEDTSWKNELMDSKKQNM